MSKKNVQVIKNARLYDVRPGDYIIWEYTREVDGVTITVHREGVAGARYGNADWYTKDGMWITEGEGEGITITIRRPINKEN